MGSPLVLIVEDHPMMVNALSANLRELVPNAGILQAGSLESGMRLLSLHPNVALLLLDLHLPDAQALETLNAFCHARPLGAGLVYSAIDCPEIRQICLANHVTLLNKAEPVNRLLDTVLQLLRGWTSSWAHATEIKKWMAHEPEPDRMQSLSQRQLNVLSQLARGKTSREVGQLLGIEESTVKTHQISIYQRLGVKNKTQASALYWQWVHRLGQHHG